MKQGMTNVDVAALAAELRPLLVGSRLEKAYQPAKDQVLLRFRRPVLGRLDVLVALGRFVTLTKRAPENPAQPSMVAKILRATFGNGRVVGVGQVGFDRVIRFDVEKGDGVHAIVVEMFGDGNLLVLDPAGTIVLPMRGEEYAHRRLKRGEPYVPPPAGPHPLELGLDALAGMAAEAKKDLVRFLALDLGFGPLWAEELCLRAGIDKGSTAAELEPGQWRAVHGAVQALADDIRRNDLAPAVVLEDGEAVDAVPFVMKRFPRPRFACEEAPTFHEALDVFFCGAADDGDDDPRRRRFEEARGKVLRQLRQMEEATAGFVAKERERRADGDALYASFQEAQQLLGQLREAREGRSWDEVEATLRQGRAAGHPAALMVPELRPHRGEAVLRLPTVAGPPRDVEVDLRLSVQENADRHYEAAKKARSRREGAARAMEDARARLQEIESRGLDGFGAAPRRADAVKRHFWFEPFRWTLTPSGLLAVGGRNAGQNDAVVKRYLREGDRYVHADIHGAPSVVVRPVDGPPRDIPEADLRAAAQFAACASRAWRQFAVASAYWVTAQQVSKTPRSGEFVPRGAWIVHGRRNSVPEVPMEWMVGRVRFRPGGEVLPKGAEEARPVLKLVGGPPAGVEAFATEAVRVVPGDMDPNEAAAALAKRFGVAVEEAQAVLPPGPVRIVEGVP